MFKAGLAKQSEVSVNWCPALGTVLANEEIVNGLSERGNHPVVRQPLRQWILKITDYADKLEDGLPGLDWPEGTLSAQKQWIGKSIGALISFSIKGSMQTIDVFTTRPDTLMGVSYLVLAPEHPLVLNITTDEYLEAVKHYVESSKDKSDMERTAVGKDRGKTGTFTGAFAEHPLSGDFVPVWIADYVLYAYGTGAVMAVPAHDERDFDFAAHFDLPVKQVVSASDSNTVELPFTNMGIVCNSGSELDGLTSEKAKDLVLNRLESLKKGMKTTTYKLRDWVFSRQRYWGEPIPIYFPVELLTGEGEGNPTEGTPYKILFDQPIAVSEDELPLKLPDMEDFHPGDDPQGCLAKALNWRFFQLNGKWFARETNTMPQVFDMKYHRQILSFFCFSGPAVVGTICALLIQKIQTS